MPELPEVETIARSLREGGRIVDGRVAPPAVGRTFAAARLGWERSLETPSPAELLARLPGQRVEDAGRRGKFLLLKLTRDTLLFHLRMSGDLWVEPADGRGAALPHTRFSAEFIDGARLVFNDARKFGRIWLAVDPQEVTGGLGPEPFDPALTPARFYDLLRERKRQLKPLLLEQSFLAGLGNIYTDEALHLAKLHPLRSADSLTPQEAAALLAAIRSVLEEGIRRNGASIDWVYRGGDFQNAFRVYQRTGQPCPVCGAPIRRIVVGQRGTHFCPECQAIGE